MSDDYQIIKSCEINDGKVEIEINKQFKSKFLSDDFWMKIDGVYLKEIPLDIITIPFILNIAPIIWISGKTYKIDSIDEELYKSLQRVKKVFTKMYSSVNWDGELVPNIKSFSSRDTDAHNSTLLFSGGLDSIASSYNHLVENQTLVTIQGSDIPVDDDDGWSHVQYMTTEFADKINAKYYFLESNFMDFVNVKHIQKITNIPGWWAYVQHGLGLTGFMSIPSYLTNSSKGYIGSTHSQTFYDKPWGSHPKIDNEINWSGFQVVHDCYELTRQKKIKLVIDKVENGSPKPFLRVCYSSRGGKNCCACEKCCRTILGLIVEGVSYKEYGFDIKSKDIKNNVIAGFNNYKFKFDDNTLFHWNDIKNHIRDIKYYKEAGYPEDLIQIIKWFSDYDLTKYKKRFKRRSVIKNYIISKIKIIPGLFDILIKIKNK